MPPPTNTANGTSEQQTQQRSKQRGSYAAPSKPYALPFGTYRPGPPSISSTISSTATSYAESIASDVTIVASRSYKSNDRQSWESPLKIKVDTNVAPSSHIWDEFYAASGGTPSSQPSTQKGSQPDVEPEATEGNEDTADAVQMMEFGARNDTDVGSTRQREENDIASSDALSELLSMFDLPQFPTQEPSTINQHLINSKSNSQSYQIQQDTSDPNARAQAQFQNDQYPGAEFLNLPDTASTTDNSQYPALFDDFDFSHFTFPINSRCGDVSSDPSIATASLDGVQEMESASNLGSSPLDTVSWKQSLERPSHAEDHSLLLHQNQNQNQNRSCPTSILTCIDATLPDPSLVPGNQPSVARTTSLQADVPSSGGIQYGNENNSNRNVGPAYDPATSCASTLDQPHPPLSNKNQTGDQQRSTASRDTPSYPQGKAHHLFPHLARLKMQSMTTDKTVIAFQREVLRVAADFYKSIAHVFESTPSEVLKIGMSRSGGVLVEDDTLADVLHDIKSLCSRLTIKAASLPGYPDCEGDVSGTADSHYRLEHSDPSTSTTRPGYSRTGSASQPIDLTAPTPRSQDVCSSTTSATAVPVVISEHLLPPFRQSPSHFPSAAALSPAPRTEKEKRQVDMNPFTPESLGVATSIVPTAATTPTAFRRSCSIVTPNGASRQVQTAMSRSPPITPQPQSQVQSFSSPTQSCLPALPPLPSPSNSRLIHGPWKPSEIERLRTLVSFSTDVEDGAPIDHVDWTWVVDNFGGTRNRHQVLIKAVELGLRESSTHHSRKIKQKGYREALEAMQSDLHEASTKPLPSPLPSLLPSARINQTFNTLRIGSVRRLTSDSSPGEQEAPRKRYKLALSPSELSGIGKDEAVRRESSSTASSDDLKTPDRSPLPPQSRAIPRALDLSLSADIKSPKSQDDRARLSTPKRPTTASLALSAGSPKTPKSTLRSMAFKPYAHPRATAVNEGSHAAADVPPATAPARSTCPRAWDGAWGMVALPGVRADGRPSILSPSFGSFDAGIGKEAGGRGEGVDVNVGYQPLLDGPVSGRRASHD